MSDPFIGQIQLFGFNFPPRGWALCDGQLLQISQYSALFALLGTTYGGDGRSTFGLPDLRSRSAVHVGSGPGLSTVTWGERSGAEDATLVTNNLPAHSHGLAAASATTTIAARAEAANSYKPNDSLLAGSSGDIYSTGKADTNLNAAAASTALSGSTDNTGNGQSFSVRNPFIGIYHCIALTGLFPSRN